ncbi:EpsG family protein [Roseivirga sp.]|uniref:EpsG family protein n=1 Tax=Roseivirga sp. TaxID=1964215 RepID=UPI003B5272D4
MFDFFTFFIYLGLLFLLILLTSEQESRVGISNFHYSYPTKLEIGPFLALILITFIVGFRYDVGVDWQGYYLDFQQIEIREGLKFSDQSYEWAFFHLMKVIAYLGLNYIWLFAAMALISWYFLFKSVPRFILPLFVYFLFVDEFFFWSLNGVRQFAAMTIWVFSLRYVVERNFIKYLLFILLGALFHLSILFLIPLYFLPYRCLTNRAVWLVLFVVTFLLINGNMFMGAFASFFEFLGPQGGMFAKFFWYYQSGKLAADETSLGLGYFFEIVTNFILIWLSPKILQENRQLSIYFVLFFFGVILFNLFYEFQLIARVFNYFLFVKSIILSLTVVYYWKNRVFQTPIVIGIVLYFFLFLSSVYNGSNMCCPYRFAFWLN